MGVPSLSLGSPEMGLLQDQSQGGVGMRSRTEVQDWSRVAEDQDQEPESEAAV